MRSYRDIKNKVEGKPTHQFKSLGKSEPFYSSKVWKNLRAYKVSLNPICEVLGCNQIVHTVDHIVPIKLGGKRLDLSNLQSLCKFHNFSKTAKQRGSKTSDGFE